MIFTNMHGEPVNVDDTETMVVEETPNYTVYQASVRGNPGETLTKVVYNNPRRNVGGGETSLPD